MNAHQVDQTGKIDALCDASVARFRRIATLHFSFYAVSSLLIFFSCIFFVTTLVSAPRSLLLAVSLTTIIISVFSFAVLRLYFQAQKPEQYQSLREHFNQECLALLPKILLPRERSLSLANAAFKMSSQLANQEFFLFYHSAKFPTISRLAKKASSFIVFRDVLLIRELFLLLSVEEHIHVVKKYPTDLEVHASLAHAYLALSRLYQDNTHKFKTDSPGFEALKIKFSRSVYSAIEEFTIIDHYAPNDPWVHAQLASCYHALEDFENELKEYERILDLCPQDREIMHRLGILYFKLGKNAKGLEIYETLKKAHHSKANELINFYDAFLRSQL